MGILPNSTWDAFSSYSSLDNELHRDWIKSFHTELQSRVRVFLEAKGYPYDLDELKFFFDTESMPANGSVEDELMKNIKKSGFLFLFVGDDYLKSSWCGKELDWFSARFSGIPKEALKSIFMIVLTPTALRNALSDGVRTARSDSFRLIRNKGLHRLAYDTNSTAPAPFGYNTDNYIKLVDAVASTLTDRFIEVGLKKPEDKTPIEDESPNGAARPVFFAALAEVTPAQAPSPPGDPVITFGAVGRRLKDYRSKLAANVADQLKFKVDCWELEDLDLGPGELNERLQKAKIFVQLIDRSPFGILGGSQPGGFLALQKALVPESIPQLWINPLDGGHPDHEEQNPDHLNFINSAISSALKLSADDIVRKIGQRLSMPDDLRHARIMIEHSDEDQEEVLKMRKIVEKAWENISDSALGLRFSGADWAEMKGAPDKFKSCHGIVVVDRSRPWATLEAQLGDIEDELAKRNQNLLYRTFVLPPRSKATIMNWEFIRFEKTDDNGQVEVITENALERFLAGVKEKALAPSAER